MVHGEDVHEFDVTTVPPPEGVATTWYPEIVTLGAPVNPGAANPIVIACEEADADVKDGAVGNADAIWNARVTLDAAAYCESPA